MTEWLLMPSTNPTPIIDPGQRPSRASSRLTRWTVPVPMPSALAVLRMPVPVASSARMRSTTSALTGRRQALSLCSGACEASIDATSDHRTLELREGSGDLIEQPACRGCRVDVLLVEVEIDTDRV